MKLKKTMIAMLPAMLFAAQGSTELLVQAAEENNAPEGVQVVDGTFVWFDEDGTCDEERTNALQAAAEPEKDITPLLELIGQPQSEEYFGQGCWFGESGEETGEDGTWYYDDFVVYVYKTGDKTYYMGSGASYAETPDLEEALETAAAEAVSENSDTEAVLAQLFTYVEDNYVYERKIGFEVYDGWMEDYAEEMLNAKAGSCYHYAALFGYLARLTADVNVRVCTGMADGFPATSWQPHAWTEVELDGAWYVYDVNMDKYGADASRKFFHIDTDSDEYEQYYQKECSYEIEPDDEDEEALEEIEEATEMISETAVEDVETISEAAEETNEDVSEEAEEETESVSENAEDTQEPAEETVAEEETETETESGMTTEVIVTEAEEEVLTLNNHSEVAFASAKLQDHTMTLTDMSGNAHVFAEVDPSVIRSPHLVMFGNFLAIRYINANGEAGRLVEEGDEIVFEESRTMPVISTVYVRTGAGTGFDQMTVANQGSEVRVIGETGKWYKIVLDDGREGYISKLGVIKEPDYGSASTGTAAQTQETETEIETETESVPEIVVVAQDGEYFRYERFTPAKDTIVEIDGKPCFVNAGGTVSEGWKELDGKLYYSEADGRLKRRKTIDGIRLGKDGSAKSDSINARLKMTTMKIVESITDDTMTQSQKLSACWTYVTRGHMTYAGKYPDLNVNGWQRSLALDALSSGSGNCYGFACAFAALAHEVGYDPVVVAGRVTGSRDQAADGMTRHSWVMIDGCHYDPEAQWAGWCGGIYGYGSYPVNHTVQKTVEF